MAMNTRIRLGTSVALVACMLNVSCGKLTDAVELSNGGSSGDGQDVVFDSANRLVSSALFSALHVDEKTYSRLFMYKFYPGHNKMVLGSDNKWHAIWVPDVIEIFSQLHESFVQKYVPGIVSGAVGGLGAGLFGVAIGTGIGAGTSALGGNSKARMPAGGPQLDAAPGTPLQDATMSARVGTPETPENLLMSDTGDEVFSGVFPVTAASGAFRLGQAPGPSAAMIRRLATGNNAVEEAQAAKQAFLDSNQFYKYYKVELGMNPTQADVKAARAALQAEYERSSSWWPFNNARSQLLKFNSDAPQFEARLNALDEDIAKAQAEAAKAAKAVRVSEPAKVVPIKDAPAEPAAPPEASDLPPLIEPGTPAGDAIVANPTTEGAIIRGELPDAFPRAPVGEESMAIKLPGNFHLDPTEVGAATAGTNDPMAAAIPRTSFSVGSGGEPVPQVLGPAAPSAQAGQEAGNGILKMLGDIADWAGPAILTAGIGVGIYFLLDDLFKPKSLPFPNVVTVWVQKDLAATIRAKGTKAYSGVFSSMVFCRAKQNGDKNFTHPYPQFIQQLNALGLTPGQERADFKGYSNVRHTAMLAAVATDKGSPVKFGVSPFSGLKGGAQLASACVASPYQQ